MQRRALKSKDAKRIKQQFSDICNDTIVRRYWAEKEHQHVVKVKAFESKCLKGLIESFQKHFDRPEYADFFGEAQEQVEIWVDNKYSQHFTGALQQLQMIAMNYPTTCQSEVERWSSRQKMKYQYALRWAEKNNYEEATEE